MAHSLAIIGMGKVLEQQLASRGINASLSEGEFADIAEAMLVDGLQLARSLPLTQEEAEELSRRAT